MNFPGTNINVVRRHNKPSTTSKTYLEFFLLENGSPTDAYQVCSVHVYPQLLHSQTMAPQHYFMDTTASSYTYGLVAPSAEVSASYAFSSFDDTGATQTVIGTWEKGDTGYYDGTPTTASSIFRFGTGHYGVVLQPDASCTISGVEQQNEASATTDYYDVWTIHNTNNTSSITYINSFNLGAAHFVNLTEPLLAKASNRLQTSRMKLGSKQQIIMSTNISILNNNISHEMKNTLTRTIIDSAGFNIRKYNEDGKPGLVNIRTYAQTNEEVQVTSDDTLVYLFDTEDLRHADFHAGDSLDIGSPQGIYYIQAVYKCFDQIIHSEEFPLVIE